jgi:hypothetical protein
LDQSGISRYFKPKIAPGNVKPFIRKRNKNTKGPIAVNIAIFPETLIPF